MKSMMFAALAVCAPYAAAAQNDPIAQVFQPQMIEAAQAAQEGRLPISCAGLFRALRLISPEGSDNAAEFGGLEDDASFVAYAMMGGPDAVDPEAVITRMSEYRGDVSTVYLTWFNANIDAGSGAISDPIGENFRSCRDLVAEWNAVLDGN